jgi:uncharacterized protein YndB with AHSA1/START domain
MPIKKDPSGRRSIEAEVEVPGTPEEVWKAIASGPGISSWFVPSTVEERVGGKAIASFGPGMDAACTITTWDPPRRYVVDGVEEPGSVATEWIVEARAGGTCIVRVVHRWFASNDDWDAQFEQHEQGWHSFFRNLRLYLTYFRGEPSSTIALTGFGPEPKDKAWGALTGLLGIANAAVGRRVESAPGAPSLAGVVERVGEEAYPEELLLRLDQPCGGVAHLFAMPMGGQVILSIRLYLYGQKASGVAAEVEPSWQAWVNRHFPAADTAGTA